MIFSQFTSIRDPLISWNTKKCAEVCHIYSISYQAFKGGKIQSLRLCTRVQTFLWWCSHSSKMGNRARPEALLSRPADMHFTFIGAALIHCHASWKKRDSRVEATRSSLYYVKCALGVLVLFLQISSYPHLSLSQREDEGHDEGLELLSVVTTMKLQRSTNSNIAKCHWAFVVLVYYVVLPRVYVEEFILFEKDETENKDLTTTALPRIIYITTVD